MPSRSVFGSVLVLVVVIGGGSFLPPNGAIDDDDHIFRNRTIQYFNASHDGGVGGYHDTQQFQCEGKHCRLAHYHPSHIRCRRQLVGSPGGDIVEWVCDVERRDETPSHIVHEAIVVDCPIRHGTPSESCLIRFKIVNYGRWTEKVSLAVMIVVVFAFIFMAMLRFGAANWERQEMSRRLAEWEVQQAARAMGIPHVVSTQPQGSPEVRRLSHAMELRRRQMAQRSPQDSFPIDGVFRR
jgi:hypothetical protein